MNVELLKKVKEHILNEPQSLEPQITVQFTPASVTSLFSTTRS